MHTTITSLDLRVRILMHRLIFKKKGCCRTNLDVQFANRRLRILASSGDTVLELRFWILFSECKICWDRTPDQLNCELLPRESRTVNRCHAAM